MTDRGSSDLHRLTALTWDASIPISFTVNVPGVPQTGHFLVPKMIPIHLCSKPMFEQLVAVDAGFGSDKFRGWFEYKARFNKNHFVAVIPWSVPAGVVVDWLIALEFPNEIRQGAKDPIDKLFEDNALPLELVYKPSDQKMGDDVPSEAILQSNFLHVDKQFAHKLWMSALLGSASEAVKLPPQIERSLRSWDPHTFFRGRRDMAKKAGDRMSNALIAYHIVQPTTMDNRAKSYSSNSSSATTQNHISLNTTLRLVEIGTEKMSTFGQLLKTHIFSQYQKLSPDQCLSTEPLASDLGLVRVLGMNPPLYTPLQFLRDNLCARDFALHVVVRPLQNTCVAPIAIPSAVSSSQHHGNNNNNINDDGPDGKFSLTTGDQAGSISNMSNSSLLNNTTSNNNNDSLILGMGKPTTSSTSNSNKKIDLDDSPNSTTTPRVAKDTSNVNGAGAGGTTTPTPQQTTATKSAPKVNKIVLEDTPKASDEASNKKEQQQKPGADNLNTDPSL